MFKKLFFVFLMSFVVSLILSCAGTQVVSGELVTNSIDRNYAALSQDEAVSLVEEYDTAEPTLTVIPTDENSFTVSASLGKREWQRDYVVVKDKSDKPSVFDKILSIVVGLILLAVVISIALFLYRRRR